MNPLAAIKIVTSGLPQLPEGYEPSTAFMLSIGVDTATGEPTILDAVKITNIGPTEALPIEDKP